jgi:4'-phosphopantetheinyl transferase
MTVVSKPAARDLVELWYIPLTGNDAQLDELAATLDEAETARANRFRWAEHRRRYVLAHGAVRAILGRRLGVRPVQVPWIAGPNGKPALDGGGDEVNLSHSGDLAFLAVSRRPVGVDVEQVRPEIETTALARHFSPQEAEALESMPDELRVSAFTAMWTRKEALVKARGGRLGQGLGIEIGHDAVVRLPGDRCVHRVRDLPTLALPGNLPMKNRRFQAAVALAGAGPYEIRLHPWNAEEHL